MKTITLKEYNEKINSWDWELLEQKSDRVLILDVVNQSKSWFKIV